MCPHSEPSGIIVDNLWSRGLQSVPVMAWQPRLISDGQSVDRVPSQLPVPLSCSVKDLVLLPPPNRVFCLSCCALSPGCPQSRSSSIISAAGPQSQDSLTWVALCLPTLLPKRNLIILLINLMCIYCIYLTSMYVTICTYSPLFLSFVSFALTYLMSILQYIIHECSVMVVVHLKMYS